jgi:serine/threonine protein kinase
MADASSIVSSLSRTTSIQHNLVREREGRKKQTFADIYEVQHEIGQGGLCKIYKIVKKKEKVGGSSRPENVYKSRGIQQIFSNFPPPSPRSRPKPIFSPVTGDYIPPPLNTTTTAVMESSTSMQQPMYFALKVFNLVLLKEDKIESLRNEVEILKTLDHKNIIKAYEAFTTYKTRKVRAKKVCELLLLFLFV